MALLMLDLDDFKRVNDIYGHAVGDQVLAELATQLRSVVRETDDVCRTGGEEFAIIVRAGDLEAAHALAERVARQVARGELLPGRARSRSRSGSPSARSTRPTRASSSPARRSR